ncbi:MAG: ureidoglycolate lyase [Paracoccaceae bacterium]
MILQTQPLTAEAFRPYGHVIETGGEFKLINDGQCRRFHDLAGLEIVDGSPGISLFQSKIRALPYACDLLERHPLGSQAFLPMNGSDYLVIVAPDVSGEPGTALAFHARFDQGVNYARNTWHGVLAPISGGGLFGIVDRIGDGPNLEEHRLANPLIIQPN